MTYVLVCSGCRNKIARTRWLKEEKFIFSQFMANLRGHMYQNDYLRVTYADMPTLSEMRRDSRLVG